jgi:hypothetical protein
MKDGRLSGASLDDAALEVDDSSLEPVVSEQP